MPLEDITPQVARLSTLIANIYFVGTPGGPWVLVDSGTPGSAACIRTAAAARYGRDSRPEAILLTHGHYDHSGGARALAEAWDVPIYAHPLERPFLRGKSAYPPKDPTVGGAMALFSRLSPVPLMDLGDRLRDLPESSAVPGLPGWCWYATPGHSPGHVSFFDPAHSVLLCGDAAVTMDLDSLGGMLSEAPRICRPPAPFTCDWDQAQHSLQLLAGLDPFVIGAGHGEPMQGEAVSAGLAGLARAFPRPRHGRYAGAPARTDENGITFLPPPVPDFFPRIAAAVGISSLAVAAFLVVSRRSSR